MVGPESGIEYGEPQPIAEPSVSNLGPPPGVGAERLNEIKKTLLEVRARMEQQGGEFAKPLPSSLESHRHERLMVGREMGEFPPLTSVLRGINRYFETAEMGEIDIPVCIDAVHAKPPTPSTIVTILVEKYPDFTRDEVARIVNDVKKQRTDGKKKAEIVENMPNIDREIAGDATSLFSRFETRTEEIAKGAAKESGSALLLPRKSRLYVDLNREETSGKTIKGEQTVEFSEGALWAEYYFLLAATDSKNILYETNELKEPFLHLSLHGMVEKEGRADIILANGMKEGQLPCDPRVARWVMEELNRALVELGAIDNEGNPRYHIEVAEEGHALCGSTINVKRRYGNGDQIALGELYQYIQIETALDLRKKDGDLLQAALAMVASRFAERFKNAEAINELPLTEADRHRMVGELFIEDVGIDDRIHQGKVGMSDSFRRALRVGVGDVVLVNGNEMTVAKVFEDKIKERRPFLSPEENVSGQVVISRKGKVE